LVGKEGKMKRILVAGVCILAIGLVVDRQATVGCPTYNPYYRAVLKQVRGQRSEDPSLTRSGQ